MATLVKSEMTLLEHLATLRLARGSGAHEEQYVIHGFDVDDQGEVCAVADIVGWGGPVYVTLDKLIVVEEDEAVY